MNLKEFFKVYKAGETRVYTSWCILPKTDPCTRKTYWLEECLVKEKLVQYHDSKYGEQETWVVLSVTPVDTPSGGSFKFS